MTLTRRQFLFSSVAMMAAPAVFGSHHGARNATWSAPLASMPIQTQELYPAVHSGRLWVAGGIARRMGLPFFTAGVWSYDIAADAWRDEPELPEARHHAAMVSTGERLFVVGGFNGSMTAVWKMLDNVLVLENGEWKTFGKMPQPQAEGVLAHLTDSIVHLATGQTRRGEANSARSDHTEVTSHWRWDTSDNTWEAAAPIPTPRNSATGGWVERELVVTGGRTAAGNLAVTEIYDADEDRWRDGAPMPLPQAGTASVVHDGSLIVFGGEIFQPEADVFPNVWRYHLAKDEWEALPDMPTPRHGIGAGLIGDSAIVVGGATEPGGRGTTGVVEALELG